MFCQHCSTCLSEPGGSFMQWDLGWSCRAHWGFPTALHWWQFSPHTVHRVTSPCGSSILPKETAHFSPPGPVEERDKGVLRSRQHSGTKPASTFTLGALDPECSDIIGLEIFTAQQAQTLLIISSGTCKVYDWWIDATIPKRQSKNYKIVVISWQQYKAR